MHELSLAEGVVRIAEDAAAGAGHAQVTAVWVEIGALSAVEPEALRFCFHAVARDTRVRGARLEIVPVPGHGSLAVLEKGHALDPAAVDAAAAQVRDALDYES